MNCSGTYPLLENKYTQMSNNLKYIKLFKRPESIAADQRKYILAQLNSAHEKISFKYFPQHETFFLGQTKTKSYRFFIIHFQRDSICSFKSTRVCGYTCRSLLVTYTYYLINLFYLRANVLQLKFKHSRRHHRLNGTFETATINQQSTVST